MYSYEDEKPSLFTDSGQRLFLGVRDHMNRLLEQAGAVRLLEAITGFNGDSWRLMACIDRMIELGEIREITKGDVAGQHRVFVSARR